MFKKEEPPFLGTQTVFQAKMFVAQLCIFYEWLGDFWTTHDNPLSLLVKQLSSGRAVLTKDICFLWTPEFKDVVFLLHLLSRNQD